MSSPLSRRRSGQRQVLLLLDWQKLSANHTVSRCAHHWVTDQSIAQSLEHFHFDDPSIPHHRETHRADRIASILLMMEAGIVFPPLQIFVNPNGHVHIRDGHHRLRAFQYLGKTAVIKVAARGNVAAIQHAVVSD
jgi:hypothetical protein